MNAPSPGEPMNAWVIDDFGGPDVFERREVPAPEVQPGHVLVRVAATSVNPIDYKIRSGAAAAFAPEGRPAVLHGDVAGTVAAVGEGAGERFSEGDAVYACAGGFRGAPHGALADVMLADADLVAPAPPALSVAEAAALPLVTLTAWEALVDKAAVGEGDRVLVHGATGGVGHVALQLAKARGAEVTVTASSAEKLQRGSDLGADHGVNYEEEAVASYKARLTDGQGFDVVFDTVGGDNIERCVEAAALNGAVASIAAREEHDLLPVYTKGLTLHTVLMLIPMMHGVGRARHGEILREAARLAGDGALRPLLDERRFTFDDIGAAHARAASGEHLGKVVALHPGAA